MRIRDIIALSATFLQLEEILEIDEFGGTLPYAQRGPAAQKSIDFLLSCVNLINHELASDYLPIKHGEIITVSAGDLSLNTLQKKVVKIFSIKDSLGKNVKYKLYPTNIKLPSGTFKIEYSYLPGKLVLEEDMENFGGRVHERVVAYGVTREYCIINGLYEEALMWHKRFEDALVIAVGKKNPIQMPVRRWS